MKGFAIGLLFLLASVVMGTNITLIVDLERNEADPNGYLLSPGESIEFILEETSGSRQMWKHDEIALGPYVSLESFHVET